MRADINQPSVQVRTLLIAVSALKISIGSFQIARNQNLNEKFLIF